MELRIVCRHCGGENAFVSTEKKKRVVKPKKEASGAKELLAVYIECFKERYGTTPLVTGMDGGVAKNLLAAADLQTATELVRHFFKMNIPFFDSQSYSLMCLYRCVQQVQRSLDESRPKQGLILSGTILE